MVLLIGLFCALLFARSPSLFAGPRFLAEEGTHYYALLQERDLQGALSLVVRGNYQLLANLSAFAATAVEAKYAAHVTTYLALLLACMIPGLVAVISAQRRWPLPLAYLIVGLLALLPHGYEVYLTATNLQWICSVCMLLIWLCELQRLGPFGRGILYVFAGACGLTGVCSCMLAPIFLARRWVGSSGVHFVIGVILAVCSLVQLAIILHHSHPDRIFTRDPFLLSFPIVLQTIVSPVIGVGYVDDLLANISRVASREFVIAAIYFIAGLVMLSILKAAADSRDTQQAAPMVACWILVSSLNVFGSIGDPTLMISGWVAARYFFFGAVCFVILLADRSMEGLGSARELRVGRAHGYACFRRQRSVVWHVE